MTEEQIKNWAREKANALEENQTLGIYDRDEDMRYDEGYNDGQVSGYEEGLIEGYHEGQKEHEWHDLRKDPKDLPKLDKTDMSDYVITDKGVAYYNGRVKSWYIQNEYILSDDVIAWCEIPTFDKE